MFRHPHSPWPLGNFPLNIEFCDTKLLVSGSVHPPWPVFFIAKGAASPAAVEPEAASGGSFFGNDPRDWLLLGCGAILGAVP